MKTRLHPNFPSATLPDDMSIFRTNAGWHLKTGPGTHDQTFLCAGALNPNVLADRLEDYGEIDCAKSWKRTTAELAVDDLIAALKLSFKAMDAAKAYFKAMEIPVQFQAISHAMDIAERAIDIAEPKTPNS